MMSQIHSFHSNTFNYSFFFNLKQWSGGSHPPRKRVSSDAQLFGEMIFGSVEMTYKGPTVKAHSIRYTCDKKYSVYTYRGFPGHMYA